MLLIKKERSLGNGDWRSVRGGVLEEPRREQNLRCHHRQEAKSESIDPAQLLTEKAIVWKSEVLERVKIVTEVPLQ